MNAQAPATGGAPDRGGQNAIAGFLYQILGTQGHATILHVGSPEDPESEARILHEALGQDAVVERGPAGRRTCELVQYKYSRQEAPPSIGEEELSEIATRLAESRTHAENAGCTAIGYRLISNRALGPTAKQLIAGAQQRIATRRRGRPRRNDQVLASLIYEQFDLEAALNNLRRMAERYGVLPHELDRPISQWIGDLVQRTALRGPTELSRRDFVTALLGDPDARPLTAESVGPQAREAIRLAMEGDLWIPPNAIHRQVMDELARAVLDHALILIDGQGGSGKTVTLVQGARERLELPGGAGALTAIEVAEHAEEDWVHSVVRRWTGVGAAGLARWRTNGVDSLVRRIRIANPNLPHSVLWLGLDGVDEVGPANQKIRHLVQHFAREELKLRQTGERPIASLVVTCRGREPFERLLPMARTEPRPLHDAYYRVAVLEFGHDELLEAGEAIPLSILSRLRAGLVERNNELGGMGDTDPTLFGDARPALLAPHGGLYSSPVRLPDAAVLRSLEHPPMWRGFVSLEEGDQHSALDSDNDALTRLGWRFIRWFLHKAALRSSDWRNIQTHLSTLLMAAARATAASGEGSHRRIEDWILPLRETGLITDTGADAFFREAASGGVVDEIGPMWAWRHTFLPRALMAGDPGCFGAPEGMR